MADEDQFSVDISKWCEAAGARNVEFARAFALRMMEEVQLHTPVLTGRLRSSIQPETPIDSWTPGTELVIITNVEYAKRIEYGFVGEDALGRRYHQTGVGMFTQAIAHADQIAEEVLAELSK